MTEHDSRKRTVDLAGSSTLEGPASTNRGDADSAAMVGDRTPSEGSAIAARSDRDGALAIETEGLVKHFGDTKAVDGVDLTVPAGGIYGLLGPNGAGKTTMIRMLATLLRPDAGTARVFGRDVVADADAVRGRVSMTGQFASVDEDLTGRENLVLLARLLGYSRRDAKARTAELLDAFGLTEAATRQVKTYSGGMRRRLDIAASIVVTPELLFLDEPTTGLDPRNRSQVWEIIRALVANGTTVLLTTQYLEEADQLADRIAVIDDGRIVAEGTPGELKASIGSGVLNVRVRDPDQREEAGRALTRILDAPVDFESDPAALSARVADTDRIAHAFVELSRADIAVTDFSLGQPSLDEVFLSLTERDDRTEGIERDEAIAEEGSR
ncbi:ATP-binding cassette domain-containing protein [Halosolutus gelatinilyticus]|uniref:ATP-binding cassette domain-containing protein n=1 Tax=Halosolutus gelatinilyticus TaxID=2931975 RepID=UPI001FF63B02|nr:ATP-binding cassette domain-containing protein [Halosolutus gelatinilyticus]